MTEVLVSERPAAAVRLLKLNRPDQLNTMTAELCEALHEELREVAADRSCRAVVLTGAGRGFCAGVDLRGYGDAPGNDGTDAARDRLGNQEHMARLIRRPGAYASPSRACGARSRSPRSRRRSSTRIASRSCPCTASRRRRP